MCPCNKAFMIKELELFIGGVCGGGTNPGSSASSVDFLNC